MNNINRVAKSVLKQVIMDADVFALCVQHAMSTEKEEIMGLLIGEVDDTNDIAYIKSALILTRSDKKADRVEISPEQLYTASTYAEKLAAKMHSPWRVLGWYHSHPHITVWPSDVDLQTQAMYQMMDQYFLGLIFAVYPNGSGIYSTHNKMYLCCFQTVHSDQKGFERKCIEFEIAPQNLNIYNLEGFIQLPKILYEEEIKSYAEQTGADAEMDNLTMLYNEAVKTVELIHIVSHIAKPLTIDLEQRLYTTKRRVAELEKIKRRLTALNNQ